MDFKRPIATRSTACHGLTATDDHLRFALCVRACRDQQGTTDKHELARMFERYGLLQLARLGHSLAQAGQEPVDGVAVEACQRGNLDGGQIGRHVPQ